MKRIEGVPASPLGGDLNESGRWAVSLESNESRGADWLLQEPLTLLRQVLDATIHARGAGLQQAYAETARRLGPVAWSLDPVARELVATSLAEFARRTALSPAAFSALVDRITECLVEDPRTAARLERWWEDLRRECE